MAGGASDGLAAAGFEVTGIDIRPQSNYPHRFIQADATAPPVSLDDFGLVWASPPCQAFSSASAVAKKIREARHRNFIPAIRALLADHPYTIIENVRGAPIRADIRLTGPMFGLHRIERMRFFELSFFALQPPILRVPKGHFADTQAISITKKLGYHKPGRFWRQARGLTSTIPRQEAIDAMGITRDMRGTEIGEAIPPAYAKYLAEQALRDMEHGNG